MTKTTRKPPAREPILRHAPHTGLRHETAKPRGLLYIMSNGVEVSGLDNARAYLQPRPGIRVVALLTPLRSGPRYQTEVRLGLA